MTIGDLTRRINQQSSKICRVDERLRKENLNKYHRQS